jgi:hypothetical protein
VRCDYGEIGRQRANHKDNQWTDMAGKVKTCSVGGGGGDLSDKDCGSDDSQYDSKFWPVCTQPYGHLASFVMAYGPSQAVLHRRP